MKKCKDCSLELEISEFHKDRSTKDGLDGRCKTCSKNFTYKTLRTPKGRFVILKRVARTKGIEMKISFLEFSKFLEQPCSYCGDNLNPESTTYFVDRIDNTKGYMLENLTSCCPTCNFMKREMTTEQLIKQCQKILNKLVGT